MRHKTSKAWGIIEPVVEQMGYEHVGTEMLNQGKHSVLRVYIDSPDGITLDDCTAVSHQVSGVLDVEDPIRSVYDLEVSSPGLDRPIYKVSDFSRFAGQIVNILMSVPLNGRRKFKGLLKGCQDNMIVIEVDGNEYELMYEQVERARLVPEFK